MSREENFDTDFQIVCEENFDTDLEIVCGEGIHFYLTEETAFYHGIDTTKIDIFKSWYDNGQKWEKCTYKEGKINGLYQRWSKNGIRLIFRK